MADHYVKASFVLEANDSDIEFLEEIVELDLWTIAEEDWRERFEQSSARFKNAFTGSDEDPFESYRELFSDPDYPSPGFEIEHCGEGENGHMRVIVSGDQIDPEAIANIIQASCPSALPTGFCYAYGCSKLRPDEFGGGFVVIMEDDVVFQGTQEGVDTALRQIEDEDTRPMVLTISDKDHGLSYWNVKEGFGRLADATVFTPAQASTMEPIIADDEPEWATMPRWPQ